ncbi:Uncharacterised protein [Burkholderia pseudomallei]|uniref:hypothetical protein n=1 Tax=Burkholderia pseudomallei TaxID=28450 RepID=UPI00061C52F1|nr:hypothetical protein [Burkholderia pseudomallei]CPF97515.1 Uncharacterised protein [Burkholderia pseudomallei]
MAKKIDMKTASTELTRNCLLGGDWEGQRVESFLERFTGTREYAEDFDEFDFLISDVVNAFPYIHYDPDTKRIVKVTNDPLLYAADREGLMYQIVGLDVVKMRMPDDDTLYEWYQAYAGICPGRTMSVAALGNHV